MSRTYVCVDLETYDPTTLKGSLDYWNGRVRIISVTSAVGSVVADTIKQPTLTQKVLEKLSSYWQDENTSIIGINVAFDAQFLCTQYPKLFSLATLKAKLVPLELVLKCALGDYSDPQEKVVKAKTNPHAAINTNNSRQQINPYGFSLAGLLQYFGVKYPLDKNKYQKYPWGQPHLPEEAYHYALLDTKLVFDELRPRVLEAYTRAGHETTKTELDFVVTAMKLTSTPINVDVEKLETFITTLTNLEVELTERWNDEEYNPNGYTPRQNKKVATEWGLGSVSKQNFINLPKEWSEEKVSRFELRIKISTCAKLRGELEKLKAGLTGSHTHAMWNSCNGTGRCTTSGSGTNYLNFQAIGARPSRFSPPIKFRELIIPKPGHVFLNLDLPTAHMRIAFALAKCLNGAKFLKEGVDCHSVVAAQLWRMQLHETITWQELKTLTKQRDKDGKLTKVGERAKQFRDLAKEVMFGRLNGSGAKNLQSRIMARTFEEVDLTLIETLVQLIDSTYPELKHYRSDIWQYALNNCTITEHKGQQVPIYDISGHSSFMELPESVRPYLRFIGQYHPSKWVDGVQEPDLDALKQPKFTQLVASIWARIESMLMKQFTTHCQRNYPDWEIIIHHYDSNLFDIPEWEFGFAKTTLVKDLDYYFSLVLCGRIPSGMHDVDYLSELIPARNWAEA